MSRTITAKTTFSISIPQSFADDLCRLCEVTEGNGNTPVSILDVVDMIVNHEVHNYDRTIMIEYRENE